LILKNKILALIFLFKFSFALAQENKSVIPLKFILEDISLQHQVKFNYIEEQIAIFFIVPPSKKETLQSKIDYIKNQTGFLIKAIENKYFTIYHDQINQTICGYLLDSENNLPIENANVTISKTSIETLSDSKGYFELSTFSTNSVKFRHLSYKNTEIPITEVHRAICPKIKLIPFIQKLDDVVTGHYLTTGISKKIDGTILVKPKKFGILAGLIEPDILQTMQQVPGITSENETISNINVRGGTHDQNLFLWNGIRIFQTGHFFGLISSFNPLLSNTITIAKNGTSPFFGESVSSLVDISSHSKSNRNNHNSGSLNLISAAFYSKIRTSKKGSLKLSGRRSFTDIYSSPTYKKYRDRILQNTIITNLNSNKKIDFESDENFYFYDLTVHYQQKIGAKNEINIDAIAIKNTLTINQFFLATNRNSALSQHNFGGTLAWKTNWNLNNTSNIHFSSSQYNLESTYQSLQNDQILDQQNRVLNFDFQLKNTHQICENFTFNNGYQYNQITVSNFDRINIPTFSRNSREISQSHALIAEGEFQSKNKKTFLKTGIRFNYFDKFKTAILEPRIQFSHSLNNTLRLEILCEQKSQTLSQIIDLQHDFLGIEKKRWTLSNDRNIPIQKSNQISLGFTYKDKNWLITLDNFYKKITGITSSSQGFQNQLENTRSIGSYQVIGTEILIQKNFKHFYTWLNYSFNDNNYFFETLPTSEFPNNFELVHTLSWTGVYEWKKNKIALGSKWHTGKPITLPFNTFLNLEDANNPKINYSQPNNSRLADYCQFNFSASKEWDLSKKTTLQTSISILNLLNKKNIINRFYRINNQNNSIESVETYSLERTPNLNVKINF
jgi:hypothetical protein